MGFLLRVRAVAAKEFWVLLRQPQLLLLLLVGPVLIMVAFSLSFRIDNAKPRAVVVAEPGSEGAEVFERFEERFTVRTRFQGVVESVEEADAMLRNDETDAVIILPSDLSDTVLEGNQAVLEVHYSSINPIYGATVPNRANGLVLDLNQAIVREGIAREIEDATAAQEALTELNSQLAQVNEAAETLATPEARAATEELDSTLAELEQTLAILELVESGEDEEDISRALAQTRETREQLGELEDAQQGGSQAVKDQIGLTDLERQVGALQETVSDVPFDVPPEVLANPFRLELDNLAPYEPDALGFYAPATLALLIQHIALSLASLAIVRERLSGAYEFFDVSPLGLGELLAGKFLTYTALVFGVNLAVAGVLVGALAIPVRGGFLKLSVAMALLTLASLAAGFLLSALSRSRLQAIQIAMLAFIASGFFSGFLFPLDELGEPAHTFAYVLPATYGIQALQDVMIRAQWPAFTDFLGFAAIFAGSLVVARILMGRKQI
ncbi:MAG: ABC transporter permease [Rubrobacteraceae bacterium]